MPACACSLSFLCCLLPVCWFLLPWLLVDFGSPLKQPAEYIMTGANMITSFTSGKPKLEAKTGANILVSNSRLPEASEILPIAGLLQ